jgi:hypothetical protein
MPTEIEFVMVHNRRRGRRPERILRYKTFERVGFMWCNHIFNTTYYGLDRNDRKWRWEQGGTVQPQAHIGDSPWAYCIEFVNGTRGVCRVVDINAALAELGAAVDLRGDP